MERINIIIKNIPNKSILKMIMKDLEYSKIKIEDFIECLDENYFPLFFQTRYVVGDKGCCYGKNFLSKKHKNIQRIEWHFYLQSFQTNDIINLLKESVERNQKINQELKELIQNGTL